MANNRHYFQDPLQDLSVDDGRRLGPSLFEVLEQGRVVTEDAPAASPSILDDAIISIDSRMENLDRQPPPYQQQFLADTSASETTSRHSEAIPPVSITEASAGLLNAPQYTHEPRRSVSISSPTYVPDNSRASITRQHHLRDVSLHFESSRSLFAPLVGHDHYNNLWEPWTFTPQTPTHTPAVSSPATAGTRAADTAIPNLTLDTETEDLNRVDEGAPEEFYLYPGDGLETGVGRASYRIGQSIDLIRSAPGRGERTHLRLPNPRNLQTLELVVTVPYELGTDPVSIEIELPPRDNPITHGRANMLHLEVTQEMNPNEAAAAPVSSADDRYGMQAMSPEAQALRAWEYVNQLPRLDLVDMPELQYQPCDICLESYTFGINGEMADTLESEKPVRLPCHHVFGHRCIRRWLFVNPDWTGPGSTQCPLCRQELPIDSAEMLFVLPEGVRREADGVSTEEHDRASEVQRRQNWARFGSRQRDAASRDAALAEELIPPESLFQVPNSEVKWKLFEELRLRGAFRPPQITEGYRDHGAISDELVYEALRDCEAHWTLRWGKCNPLFSTCFRGVLCKYFCWSRSLFNRDLQRYTNTALIGWMKKGRRMFGPRLNEEERKDYIRYHIRTNSECCMYRVSDDVLRKVLNLGAYAYSYCLDY